VIAFLFALAAGGAQLGVLEWSGRRKFVLPGTVTLDRLLPTRFGPWHEMPTALVPVEPFDRSSDEAAAETYDAIATRTFRDPDGTQVMLTLAYGRLQEQESKIHRPELCYFSQGYQVDNVTKLSVGTVPAVSFTATAPGRSETVVYWIRVGDTISVSRWQTRAALLRMATRGIVPDGVLVRASIASPSPASPAQLAVNRAKLTSFLSSATGALSPSRSWALRGGSEALANARSRSSDG
jgi:EpsI family protein